MAWIRTTELMASNRLTANAKGETTGERIFRVEYNAPSGGIDAIRRTSVMKGDQFVDASGIVDERTLCMGVSSNIEDPDVSFARLVTFDYSSEIWDKIERGIGSGGESPVGQPPKSGGGGGGGGGGGNPDAASPLNPIMQPWILRVETIEGDREAMRFDNLGTAVVNSAGDRYEPTPEKNNKITILTIDRNVYLPTQTEMIAWESYKDTVNEISFLGRKRGTVRCDGVAWTSETENGFPYAKQVCTFSIKRPPKTWPITAVGNGVIAGTFLWSNELTWQLCVLDQGFNEKNVSTGVRQPCLDMRTGLNIEMPLDGAGHRLTAAQIAAGEYVYNLYYRYEYVDFTTLLGFDI